MYVRKEALLSSQIEGTQCTLDDILSPYIDTNINQDVSDVVNYIKATEFAIERLKTLPICSRLIKETQAILLQGVRGNEKSPGEFRYSQNWIGGTGSTIKNKLSALHDANVLKLNDLGTRKAKSVMALFAYLESNPIIDIGKSAIALGLSYNTTAKAVSILEEKGILQQTDKTGRSKTYCYTDYLNILRKNT